MLDKVATSGYINEMRAVGVKALKDNLSFYVRLASGGETVLVTDRDKVVAEMHPPGHGRSDYVMDSVLLDAVQKGWLTPPLSSDFPLPERNPVARLADLLSDIARDREDR